MIVVFSGTLKALVRTFFNPTLLVVDMAFSAAPAVFIASTVTCLLLFCLHLAQPLLADALAYVAKKVLNLASERSGRVANLCKSELVIYNSILTYSLL